MTSPPPHGPGPRDPFGPPQPGTHGPQQHQTPGHYPSNAPTGPGGYPTGPWLAPGKVRAARVMMFVNAGLEILVAFLLMLVAASWDSEEVQEALAESAINPADLSSGFFAGWGVFALVLGGATLAAALLMGKGGPGARLFALVIGYVTTVFAAIQVLVFVNVFAAPWTVLALLALIFVSRGEAKQWFERPRG